MGNRVAEKSMAFAVRVVNLYKYLTNDKKEFVLSKQLLRCGTSIGANIREAECSISRKEFLASMYVSFKECSETMYWLELLYMTDYPDEKQYLSVKADCDELYRMLSSITKTIKKEKPNE